MEVFWEVLQHSLMISGFVLSMMILVTYITIQSKGQWTKSFEKYPWLRIILATLLGITPGCLGGFTVITLYSHNIVGFPALVASMIATSGDEAFLMFSMMPNKAIEIHIYLFIVAIAVGMILSLFKKSWNFIPSNENHKKYHANDPECYGFNKKTVIPQLRTITFERVMLLLIGVVFVFLILSGHHHEHHVHNHNHDHGMNWQEWLFLILASLYLFIAITVPEHFLKEHIWKHTIKRHLPKIFLWTFGAFLTIHLLQDYINVKDWIADNLWLVLLVAVLVGLIPESGPHIVFVTLFVQGSLPLSILLANSIVQDGHAALPLLGESPKSFIWMKFINLLVGLIVGTGLLLIGF